MTVNMDDLLLAGLLDNDDELILLSQVCSGSDVPSFEKGLHIWSHVRRFAFGQIYFGCTCKTIWQRFIELRFCLYTYLTYRWKHIKKTYKSQIYFIHSLTDSQRVASILNL